MYKSKSSIHLTLKETGFVQCNATHIASPDDVGILFSELRNTDRERLVTLSLDKENKILGTEVVSIGTLNSALVHPREVFKSPLFLNAKKIIFVHNHPSGDPTFSEDDIKLTKRLMKVGEMLGVEVLYHITIGDKECMCMDSAANFSHFLIPQKESLEFNRFPQLEISVNKISSILYEGQIEKPQDVYDIVKPIFNKDTPMAFALFLNSRNEIISLQALGGSEDSISNTHLHKTAILSNAASFIVCSNYELSIDKIKNMKNDANLTDIEMLDYINIYKKGEGLAYKSYKSGGYHPRTEAVAEKQVKYQYDIFEDFDKYQNKEEVVEKKTVEQKNQHLTNEQIEELIKLKNTFTEDEKNILMQYTGSGGLEKQGAEGRGLLDEYYTPIPVIEKIWQIIDNYVDMKEPLNILEPSIGKGAFLYGRDFNMDTIITGYEVSPISSKIAHALLTENDGCSVKIFNEPFESIFMDERGTKIQHKFTNSYDLVIGNPPYGDHRGRYKGLGEEPSIHEYDQYFLKRSLELVKEDGIVVFVMPSGFLRKKNNYAKEEISKLGFLLDAHRLPNAIFPTTDIGTDIVIFKKNSTKDIEIIKNRLESINNDSYFVSNPNKIVGLEKERKGRFGLEKYVEGNINDILNYETEKADEDKLLKYIDKKVKIDTLEVLTPTKTTTEPKEKKKIGTTLIINQKQDKIIPVKNNDISKKELELWLHTTATGEIDSKWLNSLTDRKDYDKQLNYYNGKYYNDFNYCQGNIYEKLDELESDTSSLSESVYIRQKEKLLTVLPKSVEIADLKLSPIDVLAKEIAFSDNQTLEDKFKHYLEFLSDDAFLNSSEWEVLQYIENRPVLGRDPVRNADVRRRRRSVANLLFNKYIKEELTTKEHVVLLEAYNRCRNAVAMPDYSKVPLLSNVFSTFKNKPLELRNCQYTGAGFLVNKGLGCLAHEVGAGKTLTSIIATNELLSRGWIQKPLFAVPKNVYHKWIKEICETIPNAKINDLSNLGAKYKGDITKLKIEPGTISIITVEGLNKLGFKQDTYEQMTYKLQDVISGINSTKRQSASEGARTDTLVGTAIKGTTNKVYFEDLGFDHIILDEAHRYKNIFTSAKIEKGEANEYSSVRGGRSSARGIKTYLATQYILNKYNNRGVFLLTATPFTNSPMEYYSMLSLLAKKRMEESGLKNVNVFMTAFMDMKTSFVIKADRTLQQEDIIERFKNARQLRRLINEYYDFKTGEELGIIRPEKARKPVVIRPTELQSKYMLQAEELFDDKDAGGPIVAITELQNITLSPFLSRYCEKPPESYKEFIEASPKIHFVIEAIKQVKKDKQNTGQIIYMPRGVEYHTLVKEYLIKEVGYKPEEVEIISGIHNNSDNAIDDIRDRFNAGQIKVLIGSDTIKEGIDLQENTTDLYTLHLPWNPLDLEQMEGRLWRYGNKWANVRSTFPLIENSVDPFIFQKLETKLKRIQNVRTDNTNESDVSELDFSELKLDLITDPARRFAAEKTLLLNEENNKLLIARSEIAFLENITEKVDTILEKIEREKEYIEHYKNYRTSDAEYLKSQIKYRENKIERYEETLKTHKEKLKGIDKKDVAHKIVKLKAELQEPEKKIESIEKEYERKIKNAKKEQVEAKIIPNDFTNEIRKIEEENKTFFVLMKDKLRVVQQKKEGEVVKENNAVYKSENVLDRRKILKFDDTGIPYEKILDNVPGVQTIREELKKYKEQKIRPIIIAGDLSGLYEFNNKYGREIADGAVEKALEVFVNEFSKTGATVGSPSGDEMWGVLPRDAKVEEVTEQLTGVLKKMNNMGYQANDDVVGLNAKFYIGRKSFGDVEKYLKNDPKTGEELPPGVIVVEGELLNSKEDVIIKPQGVSNERIVRESDRVNHSVNVANDERLAEKRHEYENEMTGDLGIEKASKINPTYLHKIIINNEFVLEGVKGLAWESKQMKHKMEQTEKLLNEINNITPEQKVEVGKILNSKTGKSILNKYSLNPEDCIVAARYCSNKENNKEEVLKSVPDEDKRGIIRNIQNEKENSMGLEI
ncbi:MAG: JAB domain-containing protein [Elusimicrobia bacterium]|nr:JAB domain-containing protein [Elusimicrobiota bacterium]